MTGDKSVREEWKASPNGAGQRTLHLPGLAPPSCGENAARGLLVILAQVTSQRFVLCTHKGDWTFMICGSTSRSYQKDDGPLHWLPVFPIFIPPTHPLLSWDHIPVMGCIFNVP